MDTSKRNYRLGPFALQMYPSDEATQEPPVHGMPRQLTRVGEILVALSYVVLVTLILLWLLYVLIPFYLSGYHRLSITQIEMSNLWLWDFQDYPLFASDWTGMLTVPTVTSLALLYIGTPIFFGLFLELLFGWQQSNWRTNTLKATFLAFSASVTIGVGILGWISFGKLFALLMD